MIQSMKTMRQLVFVVGTLVVVVAALYATWSIVLQFDGMVSVVDKGSVGKYSTVKKEAQGVEDGLLTSSSRVARNAIREHFRRSNQAFASSSSHTNSSVRRNYNATEGQPPNLSTNPKKGQKGKRKNRAGSWISNQWVPPVGWELFTPLELLYLWNSVGHTRSTRKDGLGRSGISGFSGNSVLWIGDSTSRRTALALHKILSEASSAAAKVAKQKSESTQTSNDTAYSKNTDNFGNSDEDGLTFDDDEMITTIEKGVKNVTYEVLDHIQVIDVNRRYQSEPCTRYKIYKTVYTNIRGTTSTDNTSSTNSSTLRAKQVEVQEGPFDASPVCRDMPSLPTQLSPNHQEHQKQLENQPDVRDQFVFLKRNCMGDIEQFFQYDSHGTQSEQEVQYRLRVRRFLLNFDIIIIGVGVWEHTKKAVCIESNQNTHRTEQQFVHDVVLSPLLYFQNHLHTITNADNTSSYNQQDDLHQSPQSQHPQEGQSDNLNSKSSSTKISTATRALPTIVWRTSGYTVDEFRGSPDIERYNNLIMDTIDEYNSRTHTSTSEQSLSTKETEITINHANGTDNESIQVPIEATMTNSHMEPSQQSSSSHILMLYVDWGSAIKDRSFGIDRIVGDVNVHYGPEPRIVLIQMITNLLLEHGIFSVVAS